MQTLNITILGIKAVSEDVGIVFLFCMQFECVCIPIQHSRIRADCVNFFAGHKGQRPPKSTGTRD